jgi:hypothetical protein
MNARLENPMVVGLDRIQSRQERRDMAGVLAYATLRDELIDALMSDPAKEVRVPGFTSRGPTWSAARVVDDAMAGSKGDEILHELLSIVGLCAAGKADHNLHLRASAWIATRAAEHAHWHQEDLMDQMEAS